MTGRRMAALLTLLLLAVRGVAAQETASPHGPLKVPCAQCHAAASWKPARLSKEFNHAAFGWALEGAHAATTCGACHRTLEFRGAPTACAACHQEPHRGELGASCERCHQTRSFKDQADMFRAHQQSRFPLDGAHAAVECRQCHTPAPEGGLVWVNRPTECQTCHASDVRAVKQPDHTAAGFLGDCAACHDKTRWSTGRFDHATTAYPLTGAHRQATCASCHGNGVYKGHDQACVSCHAADYARAAVPPHEAAGFPTDCTVCHAGPVQWTGATFDHGRTRFALNGAHQATTCTDCHANGVWRGTPLDCVGCHRTDWDRTTTPPHAAAGFAADCTQCHTTAQWAGAPFDHGTTAFALTGAHRTVGCAQCHGDGVYRGKPTQCVACHLADFNATKVPNHPAAAFPTDCAQCHATAGWAGALFQHSTRFPLIGGHQAVNCLSCHGDGVWRGKSLDCVTCHRGAYDRTANPPHAAAGFPTDCTSCHTVAAWAGAVFDHGATRFPLTGAHLATSCLECHGDGVYRGKPTQCVVCHQTDYDGVVTPNHRTLAFPTDCTTCHTTAAWPGAHFDHGTTRFPLTGAHLAATCADCHSNGVYAGTPSTCVGCHQTAYDRTAAPPHKALAFPTDCTVCHTTTAWPGGRYDHATTAFPLTGAHLAVTCAQCHGDGVYRGKPTQCVACHQADYDRVTTPNHRTLAFPTECTTCHNTAGWSGATFNHDATAFPLTGAHRAVSCAECHADGVYAGKPTACVSCHRAAYDGAAVPPHAALSFPTDCTGCHTTTAWPGGRYDHATTAFPLTGAHVAVACAQCHGDGVWRGKSSVCVSCHQADYDATTDPNHRTAKLPTDCVACHTTLTWNGARFAHDADYFPIYSGAHAGRWASCATCHTSSASYAVFTCLTCHEHNKTSMDDKHRAISGYRYDSQACYACHPRGQH